MVRGRCCDVTISKELMAQLFVHLEDVDVINECDNTLACTRTYLRRRGMSSDEVDALCRALNELGGFCDCEVLFNAVWRVFSSEDELNEHVARVRRTARGR